MNGNDMLVTMTRADLALLIKPTVTEGAIEVVAQLAGLAEVIAWLRARGEAETKER